METLQMLFWDVSDVGKYPSLGDLSYYKSTFFRSYFLYGDSIYEGKVRVLATSLIFLWLKIMLFFQLISIQIQ